MMRAAILARVSTEAQADNTSIPNQLDRMRAYIKSQGWTLVATFIDPGESAKNLDRSGITAARNAAKQGEYDVLVIYTLDRLTRDIDDLFLLRREFQSAGIPVLAVQDGMDVTTADVDDVLQVLFKGYFGHRERETILRRTREGLQRRAREGKYPGGQAPYGLKQDSDYLAIDPHQSIFLRRMFEWSAEGLSSWEIARRLDAMGEESPRGGPWSASSIVNMLRNETYCTGEFLYNCNGEDIVIEVPVVIDRTLWDAAQQSLDRNRTGGRKQTRRRYMLGRGMIKCALCGSSYIVRTPRRKGGPHGYSCGARVAWKARRRDAPCPGAHVRGQELDNAVWSDIVQFIQQPHIVAVHLARHREPAGHELATQIAEVDQALSERLSEQDRLLELYLRDTIPIETLDRKAEELRGRIESLEEYRQHLTEEQSRADMWEREMIGVIATLRALQKKLEDGVSLEDKCDIAGRLVKSVIIETQEDDAGEPYPLAQITYRFEHPDVEDAPIPAELTSLFDDAWRLTTQNAMANCKNWIGGA